MKQVQTPKFNPSHFAVKRIMKEIKSLKEDPEDNFRIHPVEGNIFEVSRVFSFTFSKKWHFTMRGPRETSFENGLYHGKIILPSSYPFKAPDLVILTPNGRFETNKKICLNVTSYHQESWRPSWSIRTIILALISFFEEKSLGVGAIHYTETMRKKLAKKSHSWTCENCKKKNCEFLKMALRKEKKKKKKKKKRKKVILIQQEDDTSRKVINLTVSVVSFMIIFFLIKTLVK